jgi:hypothetical protein
MPKDISQFTRLGKYLFHQTRFLKNCQEQPDGCIVWTGCGHRQGYGMVSGYRVTDNQRIMQVAHRVSMMFRLRRELTREENVIHLCNNMRCVNPEHLMVGDVYQRAEVMIAKGHAPNQARRTQEPRRQLRRRYKWSDEQIRFARVNTTGAIVREYGLTRTAASKMRYECCRLYRWLK